ncbi:hypothetical protein LCGC14_1198060 [marine sediment metagenome]|uniref:Uncharacterized protein n=1 Tax=marine sediment metagenome TaxID=412755 RepID=A0A0F9P077_9ZZZZ
MKPIDARRSTHCESCRDMGKSPDWDKNPHTRYVCGENSDLKGDEPCTIQDAKECTA